MRRSRIAKSGQVERLMMVVEEEPLEKVEKGLSETEKVKDEKTLPLEKGKGPQPQQVEAVKQEKQSRPLEKGKEKVAEQVEKEKEKMAGLLANEQERVEKVLAKGQKEVVHAAAQGSGQGQVTERQPLEKGKG